MKTRVLAVLAVAGLAGAANAQVWVEVPDAPEAPANQATVGVGPLTSIVGATNDPNDTGVDTYCITVTDWTGFSASLAGGASFDTQLFLFDINGMGIASNDDSSGVQSVLPAGNAIYAGRSAPETVMIAVSGYNRDPSSAGGLIFPNTFSGVFGPTGPGGGSPVSSWGGNVATGAYTLALTGATYCIPTPGAFALLGLGGLVAGRRRR